MSAPLLQLFMVRVLVFFFSPHLMHKRNVSPAHSTKPSFAIRRQMLPSESEEQFIFLAFMIVSWLHLRRLLPHALACLTCRPTAFLPSVNPFLLLIHPLAEMEAAAQQDSLCPSLSNDRRLPYHFEGSVMSRLAERILSLWPKTQTGDGTKRKRKRKRKAVL